MMPPTHTHTHTQKEQRGADSWSTAANIATHYTFQAPSGDVIHTTSDKSQRFSWPWTQCYALNIFRLLPPQTRLDSMHWYANDINWWLLEKFWAAAFLGKGLSTMCQSLQSEQASSCFQFLYRWCPVNWSPGWTSERGKKSCSQAHCHSFLFPLDCCSSSSNQWRKKTKKKTYKVWSEESRKSVFDVDGVNFQLGGLALLRISV